MHVYLTVSEGVERSYQYAGEWETVQNYMHTVWAMPVHVSMRPKSICDRARYGRRHCMMVGGIADSYMHPAVLIQAGPI